MPKRQDAPVWTPTQEVVQRVFELIGPSIEEELETPRPGRRGREDEFYVGWAAGYVVLIDAGCPTPVKTLAELATYLKHVMATGQPPELAPA